MTKHGQRTALQEMIQQSERIGNLLASYIKGTHTCSHGNCMMEPSFLRDDKLCWYHGKTKDGLIRDDIP